MGHKRYGYLPKTKPWITLVNELDNFSSNNADVTQIAKQALKNVQTRFDRMEEDSL